jgi:hypothetical protein
MLVMLTIVMMVMMVMMMMMIKQMICDGSVETIIMVKYKRPYHVVDDDKLI